ncbi:MAG: hypothetical protein IPK17_09535 [Chloroflexi bacterium]|uniref:hypothetical protein n=1 Tax=Candidatus Flexifilum breve TaxID=3140694 RepID=UPI003135F053|nr:hypothetical protein [Chloroflexota bacterium]
MADLPPFYFHCTLNFATEQDKAASTHQSVQGLIDYAALLLPEPLQRQNRQFFEGCLLHSRLVLCGGTPQTDPKWWTQGYT